MTDSTDVDAPPSGLGECGLDLWRSIVDDHELRHDELHTLADAARAADRVDALRAELAKGPLMVKGSMGQPVVNPLVAEVRASEAHVASLLARLKLRDDAAPASISAANRAAGAQRWQRPYVRSA